MHLINAAPLVASIILFHAFVASAGRIKYPAVFSQQICYTRLGLSAANSIPTSTQVYTVTFPIPTVVRATSTCTITPSPVTSTITSVSTSVVTTTVTSKTDTFYSTVTPTTTLMPTSTVINTVTATATSIVTTTLSATTLTVSPTDYTPIKSQIATLGPSSYMKRRRNVEDDKGRERGILAARAKQTPSMKTSVKLHDAKYAQSVQCKQIVEKVVQKTITLPGQKTVTVTVSPNTVTSISKSTFTSTSTILIGASTIVTSTASVSTITSTILVTGVPSTTITTITQSSTVTPSPLATVFAACQASDNLLTYINGKSIINSVGYNQPNSYTNVGSVSSVYDCCNQCQASALVDPTSCHAFYFNTDFSLCKFGASTTSPYQYKLFYGDPGDQGLRPFQVGNGPGGQLVGIGPA